MGLSFSAFMEIFFMTFTKPIGQLLTVSINTLFPVFLFLSFFWEWPNRVWNNLFQKNKTNKEADNTLGSDVHPNKTISRLILAAIVLVTLALLGLPFVINTDFTAGVISAIIFLATALIWKNTQIGGGKIRRAILYIFILYSLSLNFLRWFDESGLILSTIFMMIPIWLFFSFFWKWPDGKQNNGSQKNETYKAIESSSSTQIDADKPKAKFRFSPIDYSIAILAVLLVLFSIAVPGVEIVAGNYFLTGFLAVLFISWVIMLRITYLMIWNCSIMQGKAIRRFLFYIYASFQFIFVVTAWVVTIFTIIFLFSSGNRYIQ
jgi:hypothetical protein